MSARTPGPWEYRFVIQVAGCMYEGLFTDSCAAVLDAMERFPGAGRISVRAI